MLKNNVQFIITIAFQTRHVLTQAQTPEKRFNFLHYDLFPVKEHIFFGPRALRPVKLALAGRGSLGLWAPESTETTILSTHPGGELKSSCRMFSYNSRPIRFKDPTQTTWALHLLRLSIFSTNQGPAWALKTRALYKDQSQRAHHIVTENVPTLVFSPPNVPTLVMFVRFDQ